MTAPSLESDGHFRGCEVDEHGNHSDCYCGSPMMHPELIGRCGHGAWAINCGCCGSSECPCDRSTWTDRVA